jgi:hypothetical protein
MVVAGAVLLLAACQVEDSRLMLRQNFSDIATVHLDQAPAVSRRSIFRERHCWYDDVAGLKVAHHLAALPAPTPEMKGKKTADDRIQRIFVALQCLAPKRIQIRGQKLVQQEALPERLVPENSDTNLGSELFQTASSCVYSAFLVPNYEVTLEKHHLSRMRIDLEEPLAVP